MFVFDAERVGKWVTEKAGGRFVDGNTAIGWERDGKLVAGAMYESYKGPNGSITMAGRIDSKFLPPKFYWMIFDYPFNQLKVEKIVGFVSEKNRKAQVLDEHLGFVLETRIKNYLPDADALVYSMTKEQCRFIGAKYAKRAV
jgi:hypothetical protein